MYRSTTFCLSRSYGSGIVSKRTGILLNNAMDDFSIPSKINYFGIRPSLSNYIAPRKQPLSSMVPSVFVDRHGDVKMVVGAAGGTKITTAVSQVRKSYIETVEKKFHWRCFVNETYLFSGDCEDPLDGPNCQRGGRRAEDTSSAVPAESGLRVWRSHTGDRRPETSGTRHPTLPRPR